MGTSGAGEHILLKAFFYPMSTVDVELFRLLVVGKVWISVAHHHFLEVYKPTVLNQAEWISIRIWDYPKSEGWWGMVNPPDKLDICWEPGSVPETQTWVSPMPGPEDTQNFWGPISCEEGYERIRSSWANLTFLETNCHHLQCLAWTIYNTIWS